VTREEKKRSLGEAVQSRERVHRVATPIFAETSRCPRAPPSACAKRTRIRGGRSFSATALAHRCCVLSRPARIELEVVCGRRKERGGEGKEGGSGEKRGDHIQMNPLVNSSASAA